MVLTELRPAVARGLEDRPLCELQVSQWPVNVVELERPLRIAQIAPPLERVPPAGYGGTERVIHVLTEELVCRGHQVTLFASGDSTTSAELIPTVERALWRDGRYRDFGPLWSAALARVTRELDRFDIVHSHVDAPFFPAARLSPTPVVTTLHGRLDLPELAPLYREIDDLPLVSISDAQRAPFPNARWVGTVYNGIDLAALPFRATSGGYLAFLGRISPEKGLDVAIRVARRAGLPLRIAAREPLPYHDDPNVRNDWEYYDQVVKPLLKEPGIELIGEVSGADKADLLGGAAGLLFPIRWPEPFGLVMAEALACGTPVVAFGRGSVPEVVDDGVTGLVVAPNDEPAMARDLERRLSTIDRRACRRAAEARFSPAAMADGYERVYANVIHETRVARVLQAANEVLSLGR